MDHKKAPSPFAVLWGWASGEHGGFYASVALAVLGVACGMVPYFCVAALIGLLLKGAALRIVCPGVALLWRAMGERRCFPHGLPACPTRPPITRCAGCGKICSPN